MTRETKVGLLVGLAFIIIVGILLSEPLSHSNEAQPAQLPIVGNNVRAGVTTPGAGQAGPISIDSRNVTPQQPVPLRGEIVSRGQNGGNGSISIGPGGGTPQNGNGGRGEIGISAPPDRGNGPVAVNNHGNEYVGNGNGGVRIENGEHARGSIDAGNTLSNGGRPKPRDSGSHDVIDDGLRSGDLIPVGGRGQNGNGNNGGRTGNIPPAGSKQYTAAAGDSLAKIASKAYGNNSKPYRDAIIQANPSLQPDANKIIAGRTYVIPPVNTSGTPAAPTPSPAPSRATAGNTPAGGSTAPAAAGYVYTVKESDSLWKIARDVCGDAGAVAAIKELNKEALAGGDQVRPNMKLRLPTKPVASTN